MALEVGSVYARAGFHYDDTGADRFERRLKETRASASTPIRARAGLAVDDGSYREHEGKLRTARTAASNPIRTRAGLNEDESSYRRHDERLRGARAKSKVPMSTRAGVNVDERGFRRYEERMIAARSHGVKFGAALTTAGIGARASLLGVQGGAVAAGGALAGVVFAGARFEQKMNAVKAVTGANKREMKLMSDAAIDMGTKTGLGAAKAADAVTELAKGGLTPAQIAAGGLRGALALAAAGNLELADAASGTANALNLFGLQGRDATHVADAFATAANATTADVGDFALALSQGGAAAKAAGLTFDQTVVALEALAANGVKGSDAGTSLKSMLTQIANPTKQARDLMEKLNLQFFDGHGKIKSLSAISEMLRDRFHGMSKEQRLATAAQIAGTDGMRGLLALADTGPRRIDKFKDGIKRHGSAAHAAAEQQKGLAGGARRLIGSLEALGIKLSKDLNPQLDRAARHVAKFLDEMRKDKGAGGSFRRTMGDVGTVLHAFGIAVGVALRTVGGTVKRVVDGIRTGFSGIRGIFRGVAKIISSIVHGDIKGAINGLGGVIRGSFRLALGVLKLVTAPFRAAFSAIFRGLAGIARGAFGGVSSAVRSVLRVLSGAASTLLGILSDVAHAASHLPVVGGAFRKVANSIDDAKASVDRYRDSLNKTNRTHRTTQKDVGNARDEVEKWRKRVNAAKKGSDEHRAAVARLNRAHRTYLRTLLDTQPPAKRAARNVGWIGTAARAAAGTVARSGDNIAHNLSQLAKDLGAKGPRFKAAFPKVADIISPFARGGFVRRATGGFTIGREGDAGRDEIPVMADPRGAFLTRHQAAALGAPPSRRRVAGTTTPGTRAVPVLAGSGERYVPPEEISELDTVARLRGFAGGLAELFSTVDRPHYMARGGFVHVSGDPAHTGGRDRVAASIAPLVSQWVKRYRADIGYAYDPGGGHKSPGHNVTGTATDVYPGPGGNWDLLERGLRALSRAGYTIYYGTHGIGTALAGHGRGNHAHIEWGSGGHGIGAATKLGRIKLTGPDGALKRVVRGALDRMTKQGNDWLEEQSSLGGADYAGGAVSAAQARKWIIAGLRLAHVPASPGTVRALMGRAKQESGWNPNAVNRWDSNARAGHPSIGFLQTIGPTFDRWKVRGHGNIRNPVDNVAAAVRYMLGTYGHIVGPGSGGYSRGGFVRAAKGKPPTLGDRIHTALASAKQRVSIARTTRTKADDRSSLAHLLNIEHWRRRYWVGRRNHFAHEARQAKGFAKRADALKDYDHARAQLRDTDAEIKRFAAERANVTPGGDRQLEEGNAIGRQTAAARQSLTVEDTIQGRPVYGGDPSPSPDRDTGSVAALRKLIGIRERAVAWWRQRIRHLHRIKDKAGEADAVTKLGESFEELQTLRTSLAERTANPFATDAGGDTTGEDTTSPLAVATAALAQVNAFDTGRDDLFAQFGDNFARASAGSPFSSDLSRIAGLRNFGAGSATGGDGLVRDGSRKVTQNIAVTLQNPGDVHTFTRATLFEMQAAA